MAAEVLSGAVDNDRGSEGERVLVVGVGECAVKSNEDQRDIWRTSEKKSLLVDDERDAVFFGYSTDEGDRDEGKHGVGGCLDPDDLLGEGVSKALGHLNGESSPLCPAL